MKTPLLEVVKFDEVDIIVTSGLPYAANPSKVSFGNWYAAYSVEVDQSGNTHDHPDGWYHFMAYRTDGADGYTNSFYRGVWDGIEYTKYSVPRLATVQQNVRELAQKSVEDLLWRMNYKREAVHKIIQFRVITGESMKVIKQ